jgi:hypothetical protein
LWARTRHFQEGQVGPIDMTVTVGVAVVALQVSSRTRVLPAARAVAIQPGEALREE